MADLEVEICDLSSRNLVLPTAGPPVRAGKPWLAVPKRAMVKTVSVHAAEFPVPNRAEVRGSFLNIWS
jgi:dihydroorotate dehydrogenase (NAD+) catalytic subunit